ncbi:MAG TPA: HAMP domain-containing sensor histidine kinase [Candidatus Saccharimonadales bacterium]|nr:HAMP domain-containing sensor histidine kinase [Candidatus Saccharimonadales bacterium]
MFKNKYLSVSNRPFLVKYALALSSIIYILLPDVYHSELLWSVSPFLMLIPSIIVTSWYGGLLPGLFATVVGIIVGDYFFTHPFYTFIITDTPDMIRVTLFGIIGILISILSQLLHNALAKAKEEAQQQKHTATLLKELDKQKSTFLNVVAHELKTPITIIRILTYRIIDQYRHIVEKETMRELDGELERLTILVDDLLDISRIEKGKLLIEKKRINLSRLIKQVVTRMQEISPHHSITYAFSKNIFIVVDELRIKQVLINLLANAVKHSGKKTRITISLHETKENIIVAVKDQGIGIDPKEQPRIFDMFYQVQNYFTKGFGLGLYISKEIMQQHNGKIWVESKKGKGATFYFSLPKSS